MKRNGWLAACLIAVIALFVAACGDIENDRSEAEEAEEPSTPECVEVCLQCQEGTTPAFGGNFNVSAECICVDEEDVDEARDAAECVADDDPDDDVDDGASVDDDVEVTCEADCPQGTIMTRLVCSANGTAVVEVECSPVEEPPVTQPPPTQPPSGATVTVEQDEDSIRLSLSGDYRNLGAWQSEGAQPLAAGTILSGCMLTPASSATGWDGVVTPGTATSAMTGDTATVEWNESAGPANNCAGIVDGIQSSTAQVIFTFRAICPDGKTYWPDFGAWRRSGVVFTYWTDSSGTWRGGLCRKGSGS